MRGLFETMAAPSGQAKSTDISALTWQTLLGPSSKTGAAVNINTALQVSTLLAGTRVLAEGVAQVPLKVYREGNDGSKTPARDLPIYKLLYRRPNDFMTAFEFREVMMFHAVLMGNGVALKNRVNGVVRELLPLTNVAIKQMPDWSMVYQTSDSSGVIATFSGADVVHLKGPTWNGAIGLDIIRLARESIGLAISTEETHARLHANGLRAGGLLSIDEGLSPEARERIKSAVQEQAGLLNQFKTMVLDKGATYTPFGSNGVDAQHIATRQLQIEEICRFLRVFPQMVGYADKTATFASAEAFFLAHVVHSIQPWIERWEEVIARDLLDEITDPQAKDGELIARFSLQALMRGDSKSRAEFYASGILNGWLKRNEARRFEELDPVAGGDELLVPLNMTTVGAIAQAVKSLIGHNGGAPISDAELETKIGRVLSSANEKRIVSARDELNTVLGSLGG